MIFLDFNSRSLYDYYVWKRNFSMRLWRGIIMADLKYLNLLAKDYPNISAASAEIVNLSAILALPKGTE